MAPRTFRETHIHGEDTFLYSKHGLYGVEITYMTCQCVEEEVVSCPCPSCSRDDSARVDDLGVEGYDDLHSRDVLDLHDHGERVVGCVASNVRKLLSSFRR
jgi:hypothetical protein